MKEKIHNTSLIFNERQTHNTSLIFNERQTHNTSPIFNERQTHGNFESILIQFEDISSHLELNGVIWRANNDAKKKNI